MVAEHTKPRQQQRPGNSVEPDFRFRIIDHLRVPAEEIVLNPLNPRYHPEQQTAAVSESLRKLGWLDEVKVWRRADGRLVLIDGEDRTKIASGQLVPVAVTDLTEQEAAEALAVYDATTHLALYDSERTDSLLRVLGEQDEATKRLLRAVADEDPARAILARLRQEEDELRARLGVGSGGGYEGTQDDGLDDTLGDQDGEGHDDEPDSLAWDADDPDLVEKPDVSSAVATVFDHDAIISSAIAHYRATGFPYRKLPVYISMQRINKLSNKRDEQLLRTYTASDVADTYHPHRFHAAANGMKSPVDGFNDDRLLRKAITFRLEGVGTVEDGYLPAMSVVTGVQACYNFRPGFACYLYRQYAKPGDTVLDTSTGYGGRLVGFMASGIADPSQGVGRYIGIDPHTLTHAGNTRMAEELGFAQCVELYNLPAEDVDPEQLRERCDFAFTSPPYFARELYSDEDTQSYVRYPTGDEWRAGFLQPMLALNFAALRPGKTFVLNIDNVAIKGRTYPLVEWAREDAIAAGFAYVETKYFDFASSAMGAGHDPGEAGSEPVLIFRKPELSDWPDGYVPGFSLPRDERPRAVERIAKADAKSRTLAQWMARAYTVAAKEANLCGELGIWPSELREYLDLLCRAHSPEPARFRVQDGLLLPQGDPEKPDEPQTALVLFSGGKDSIAAAVKAERAGWQIRCVHVHGVNRGYGQERTSARRIAELMGWPYQEVHPDALPPVQGISLVRDQYLMGVGLDVLDVVPGGIAVGTYAYEDVDTAAYYTAFQPAFTAFDVALRAVYGTRVTRLPHVADEVEALSIFHELPDDVKALNASCLMLPHNKVEHRRRVLAQGVPLDDFDCGVCEKCRIKALILARTCGVEYPPEYLKQCRRGLIERMKVPIRWSHMDPLLRMGTEVGASQRYFCREVVGIDDVVLLDKGVSIAPVVRVLEAPVQPLATVSALHNTNPAWLIPTDDPETLTAVQECGGHWLKREDLFQVAGVNGAVARDVWTWMQAHHPLGVVTCGGIHSSQIVAVAAIGQQLGIPVAICVPQYKTPSREVARAIACGAELVGVQMGYPRTVAKRAQDTAKERGWMYLPYAHTVAEAIANTAAQTRNIPGGVKRIVTAVGNGMTTCGVATGLFEQGCTIPILGVVMGSMREAQANLARWVPEEARALVTLVGGSKGKPGAHDATKQRVWWGVGFDPYFEAKVAPWIEPGDCFWIMSNSDAVTAGE